MSNDTWLKLHTSLLTSSKYVSLPSNDHRTAFISLLLLAKKGLESAPECYLLGHIFLSKRRWKVVRQDLIDVGLLDSAGSVKGFEESQLSPSAVRVRRHRSVTKGVTGNVTCNGDSREQRAESREEGEKRGKPATPTVDLNVPEGTPASPGQISYARSVLRKQGSTIGQWLDDHKLRSPLTSEHVDMILDEAKSQPDLTADQQETRAKNAALRLLRSGLEEVHERDGPDRAREWITEQGQAGGIHQKLIDRLHELNNRTQEAVG